ncbi:hypothetical protein [Streptomyces spectabilis]|uniref:Uncharacterized protein n=1 Tax=Streptomyces spectabilis TaxID=68270 RepID=A0A7W8B271_STRST|nr:hypothetical protein [Streptomyces spectabilis]MBB5108963.1 hypothetical protein [Streptomyces spectabilis]GGV50399.1 hypothetical protein GCM10010245_79340 [Streptomyces spectabilis]
MSGQAKAMQAALMVLVLDLLHWLLPALVAHPMARLCAVEEERFATFAEPAARRSGRSGP